MPLPGALRAWLRETRPNAEGAKPEVIGGAAVWSTATDPRR